MLRHTRRLRKGTELSDSMHCATIKWPCAFDSAKVFGKRHGNKQYFSANLNNGTRDEAYNDTINNVNFTEAYARRVCFIANKADCNDKEKEVAGEVSSETNVQAQDDKNVQDVMQSNGNDERVAIAGQDVDGNESIVEDSGETRGNGIN